MDHLFDQADRPVQIWQEFLQGLPPDMRDPQKLISVATGQAQELQQYHDWYHHQYLPWKDSFDWVSYQEYLEWREQRLASEPQTAPVEPPILPSPQRQEATDALAVTKSSEAPSTSTLPPEDHVWNWGDLVEVQPNEAEDVLALNVVEEDAEPPEAEATIVSPDPGEEPASSGVPPVVEEAPPTGAQVSEESDTRNTKEDANPGHGGFLGHIKKLSSWFWGR